MSTVGMKNNVHTLSTADHPGMQFWTSSKTQTSVAGVCVDLLLMDQRNSVRIVNG